MKEFKRTGNQEGLHFEKEEADIGFEDLLPFEQLVHFKAVGDDLGLEFPTHLAGDGVRAFVFDVVEVVLEDAEGVAQGGRPVLQTNGEAVALLHRQLRVLLKSQLRDLLHCRGQL